MFTASLKSADSKFAKRGSKAEVKFSLKAPETPADVTVARSAEVKGVEKRSEKRLLRSKSAGLSLHRQNAIPLEDTEMTSSQQPPSEHDLYSEAKLFDRTLHSQSASNCVEQKKATPVTSDSRPTRRSRITKTTRDMLLRSRSVPRALPLDDDVSEAGTYTIDAPHETRDVAKARKSIDEIFNVPGKRSYVSRHARADGPVTSSAFKPVTGVSRGSLLNKPSDVNGNVNSGAGARAGEADQEDVFSPRRSETHKDGDDDKVGAICCKQTTFRVQLRMFRF